MEVAQVKPKFWVSGTWSGPPSPFSHCHCCCCLHRCCLHLHFPHPRQHHHYHSQVLDPQLRHPENPSTLALGAGSPFGLIKVKYVPFAFAVSRFFSHALTAFLRLAVVMALASFHTCSITSHSSTAALYNALPSFFVTFSLMTSCISFYFCCASS